MASRRLPRFLASLRRRDGIALPTTMIMLMIITTAGAVAIKEAFASEGQSVLDRNVKRAIDAADAGFDTAIYRMNKMKPNPNQCVVVNGSGTLVNNSSADGNGWCPAQTEDLGDGASYSYQMTTATSMSSNGQNLLQRKIVATGIIDFAGTRTVRRRTYSQVAANTGNPLVGNYAVISADKNFDVDLQGTARINGDLGSNANIRLSNNATVCGDIIYGQGKSYLPPSPQATNNGPTCSGYDNYNNNNGPKVAPQPFVLGPVEQGNVQTSNDNGSLPLTVYNSTTRALVLNNQSVTLSGNNYSFCKIEMTNTSRITIAPRLPFAPPLRIYIDSPENCGNESQPFSMRNSSEITNLNADPSTLTLFVVGSGNRATNVNFSQSSSAQVAMVVYAPYSTCYVEQSANIRGAVACNRVVMRNSSQITWDPLVGALTMTDIPPLYRRYSYVECDKTANPSPPTTGCS